MASSRATKPATRPRRVVRPAEVNFTPAGVCVLQSRHARGFRMEPTRHDYLKVLLVFSGAGALLPGGGDDEARASALAAGDLAVVPPGCVHRLRDRRPMSLYVVCFRVAEFRDGYAETCGGSGEAPRVWRGVATDFLEQARRLLHEQDSRRAAADAMARGLAWQFLAALARLPETRATTKPGAATGDPTGSRERVRRAAEELRHGFYEAWSLDEAARRAGLGRRRFSQLFVELHGRTWWKALQAARLDHAEKLLAEDPRRSVAAVAFECGYGDLSGFYRAWKSRRKGSPQAWRLRRMRCV
jgi:Transcriptional regulator containing an amidase domain and an AraC-type DNA-binding HTH domain